MRANRDDFNRDWKITKSDRLRMERAATEYERNIARAIRRERIFAVVYCAIVVAIGLYMFCTATA